MSLTDCNERGTEVSYMAYMTQARAKHGAPTGVPAAPPVAKQRQISGPLYLIAVILSTVAIIVALTVPDAHRTNSTGGSSKLGTLGLNAYIVFSGTGFVIKNMDTFDWDACKIEVNPHGLSSGYVVRGVQVRAGDSIGIPATDFANSDRERFDPVARKPLKLSLWCAANGRKGFALVGW